MDDKIKSYSDAEEIKLIYALKLSCGIEELLEKLQTYKSAKDKVVNEYKVECEIDISTSSNVNVNLRGQEHGKLEEAVNKYIAAAGKPSGISSTNLGNAENTRRY